MTETRLIGSPDLSWDAIVVGGGLAGINALYRLRQRGLRVKLLEAGSGLGGTWFWNRYPGCRVDLESLEYSYNFSEEIQQEWNWSYKYSSQEQVRQYLEWVTDKLGLREHMQFNSRVREATYQEGKDSWTLTTESGETLTTRFCVMAVGFLSAGYIPSIPGIHDFEGTAVHTGSWPAEGIDWRGKRVGLVGTGATGVQIVPIVARDVGSLTVFQRTPNWNLPIRDYGMPPEYEKMVKANYAEIRRLEKSVSNPGAVLVDEKILPPETRSGLEFSEEERERRFEQFYDAGTALFANTFADIATNAEVNDHLRRFLTAKIKKRVKDPAVAELLTPSHGPLTRRPPGETGYYEAFNQDNVLLVDAKADPIVAVTKDGVRLASGAEHTFDILIFATGFDAGVGAFEKIAITGRSGRPLREVWRDGPTAHLGLMVHGFPNMFMYNGPLSPCAFFSPFLLVDETSRYITSIVDKMEARNMCSIEPAASAEREWCHLVNTFAAGSLMEGTDSWWLGSNIPGHQKQLMFYLGKFESYDEACNAALAEFDSNFTTERQPA